MYCRECQKVSRHWHRWSEGSKRDLIFGEKFHSLGVFQLPVLLSRMAPTTRPLGEKYINYPLGYTNILFVCIGFRVSFSLELQAPNPQKPKSHLRAHITIPTLQSSQLFIVKYTGMNSAVFLVSKQEASTQSLLLSIIPFCLICCFQIDSSLPNVCFNFEEVRS